MKNNDLSSISTRELVDELTKRPGIIVDYADPYEDKSVEINGPTIVLVIAD